MAPFRRSTFFHIFTGVLVAAVILPEFLLAVPVTQLLKDDGWDKAEAAASSRRLVRHRRDISWYKQHSDFWNWYKYLSDTGNQDGVAELDRMYLAYLQNKNRAEARRSHKIYLKHLGDIYKSCAESDDPNCVASYTSRPKPKVEPPKPAPLKSCDPFRDPYCLYALGYTAYPYLAPAPVKAPAPAPVKTPAYIHTPVVKDPRSGYYYYSPSMQPFLSAEQKTELLRICDAEDVECLQYHLRAAYGYGPTSGSIPSYAHLGCDPKTDPKCVPQLVQKAPSGLYLRYPNCDPRVDPYCAYAAALEAAKNPEPPSPAPLERPCNPLFEDNCNPLSAMKFANLASASEEPKDEPAPVASAMRAPPSPNYNPLAMYHDAVSAATLRRGPSAPRQPQIYHPAPSREETRHPLGPPGKTKEGYDCFIGYDAECYPVRAQNERPSPHRQMHHSTEAYEPHLNADGTRNGVIEPDPDCDPEFDSNCRLQRYKPEAEEPRMPSLRDEPRDRQYARDHREEPVHHEEVPQQREEVYHEQQSDNLSYDQQQYDTYMSGQEDPSASYGPQEPSAFSFQDILRSYGGRYPGQDDHRAYTGEYKK